MAPRSPTPRSASAIRQANLREHNLGLVLRIIVDATGPRSRADIAATTGLTRATVSSLVDALIEAGLVAELPPVMSQRAGRPPFRWCRPPARWPRWGWRSASTTSGCG